MPVQKKLKQQVSLIAFFVIFIFILLVGVSNFRQYWWWNDTGGVSAMGRINRQHVNISGLGNEGLVAYKYKEGVFHFRWSTLGSPHNDGFWPFVKTAKSKEMTGYLLKTISDYWNENPKGLHYKAPIVE